MSGHPLLRWQCPGHVQPQVVQAQWGRQAQGIPPGGPLDRCSATTCNHLLQQEPEYAVLEWYGGPLQLTCLQACQLVVGGAPRAILLDGHAQTRYSRVSLQPGMRLDLGPAQGGSLGYLALRGGVRQASACHLSAVQALSPLPGPGQRQAWQQWAGDWAPAAGVLRCLAGPEWHEDLRPLLSGPYYVTAARDRRGMRLQGPPPPASLACDIVSGPTVDGLVQLTPGGPIILLRDRGTIGGYLRAWVVIEADLDLAAQLPVGSRIRFELVTYDQARDIRRRRDLAVARAIQLQP